MLIDRFLDWTNEGFDPYAAPQEAGTPYGRKNGNNLRVERRGPATCRALQTELFIDGEFIPAEDGATLPMLNPHDNSAIAHVAMAGKADVDKAVAAARAAFPKWSRMAAMERGHPLLKLAYAIAPK